MRIEFITVELDGRVLICQMADTDDKLANISKVLSSGE
jgi:hypothetical protein